MTCFPLSNPSRIGTETATRRSKTDRTSSAELERKRMRIPMRKCAVVSRYPHLVSPNPKSAEQCVAADRREDAAPAERQRWAAESNMSSERNPSRYQQHNREGANDAAASSIGAVCSSASQFRPAALATRHMSRVAPSVVVPSLGAQLRSSPQGACISSRRSVPCSHIASRSPASSTRRSVSVQGCPLPNKRFELTAQRLAPLGSRSAAAPAAQPER
jgi:hypothetical protein